jgi:hypothetical protein
VERSNSPVAQYRRKKCNNASQKEGRVDWEGFLERTAKEQQVRQREMEKERRRLRQQAEEAKPLISPFSQKLAVAHARTRAREGGVHERLFKLAAAFRQTSGPLPEPPLSNDFTFNPRLNEESLRLSRNMEGRARKRRQRMAHAHATRKKASKQPSLTFRPDLKQSARKSTQLLRRARSQEPAFESRLLSSVLKYYMRLNLADVQSGRRQGPTPSSYQSVCSKTPMTPSSDGYASCNGYEPGYYPLKRTPTRGSPTRGRSPMYSPHSGSPLEVIEESY